MPPNISSTSRDSNHLAPFHQQNQTSRAAGPSDANSSTTIVNISNSRHEPKSTLPNIAKRQSKRRAEPSPSTVIEISSDEDEPPTKKPAISTHLDRKRIKNLEEENRQLKTALESALEADILGRGPVETTETLVRSMEDHVTCEICTLKMWSPYSLSCGHTFCGDCLQKWFATAYTSHLEHRPAYNPQTLIPDHFFAMLAQPTLPSFHRRDIIRQIAITVGGTSHPKYTCPTCRLSITVKPAENFVIKNIVQTVTVAQGQSAPERSEQPPEGPFHRFFPWARWL